MSEREVAFARNDEDMMSDMPNLIRRTGRDAEKVMQPRQSYLGQLWAAPGY